MKRFLSIGTVAVMLLCSVLPVWATQGVEKVSVGDKSTLNEIAESFQNMKPIDYDPSASEIPYYRDITRDYKEKGYVGAATENKIEIDLGKGQAADGTTVIPLSDGSTSYVYLEKEVDYTWPFDVVAAGLYQIVITYRTKDNKGSDVSRGIQIDGKTLFQEMLNVSFDRLYQEDIQSEAQLSVTGDQLRRRQQEVFLWQTYACTDNAGFLTRPFEVYLSAGQHTVTLQYGQDELDVAEITFAAPDSIPAYRDMEATYQENKYEVVSGRSDIRIEAEDAILKNDPSVRAQSSNDPQVTPYEAGSLRYNIFGDNAWSSGNQWAEWAFSVQKAGLYQIMLKTGQWYNDGRPSYRQVKIDGKVPCQELEAYEIPYDTEWNNTVLADKQGQPYLIYLSEGEHRLRLTVQVGAIYQVVQILQDTTLQLSDILRQIIMVTGYEIDPNYRYELDKKIPGLMDQLGKVRTDVRQMMQYMEQNLNSLPYVYYSMQSMDEYLEDIIATPDLISIRFSELEYYQSNMGVWITDLQKNCLALDTIYISSPQTDYPRPTATFFQKTISFFYDFMNSFLKDYRNVGQPKDRKPADKSIDVWVSLGREYVEELSTMVNNDFVQQENVLVNVSMFPQGQLNSGSSNMLLLAINAGTEPDVVIGGDSNAPVEFAIRNAVKNLQDYPDFDKVKEWFANGSLTPYEYENGVYGLPCTQDFMVTFYRKDILSSLGIGLPDTWDDIYKIIGTLGNQGYEFYYPQFFDSFLYQHGGGFYNEDGSKSALDSVEAYEAFKQFTELYTHYKVPVAANFYNRFRTGEIPIGIGGYTEYVQLSVAAPELKGRWGITFFPGTKMKDGTINRSVSGSVYTSNMILSTTAEPDASWTFLKWWMGEEAQKEFGRQMETVMGVGGRWNSANVAAFRALPMPEDEIEVITTQWQYNCQQPVLLGSFATSRYLSFAINDVLVGGKNPRDALESATKQINREIKAKREEYGLTQTQ